MGKKERTGVGIGNMSFSGKLKQLSFANFKKYWNECKHDKDTGLSAEKAAPKFGIKTS